MKTIQKAQHQSTTVKGEKWLTLILMTQAYQAIRGENTAGGDGVVGRRSYCHETCCPAA
jgi:hypothetical protein